MKVLTSVAASALAAEEQMSRYAKRLLPDSSGITESVSPQNLGQMYVFKTIPQQVTKRPFKK